MKYTGRLAQSKRVSHKKAMITIRSMRGLLQCIVRCHHLSNRSPGHRGHYAPLADERSRQAAERG